MEGDILVFGISKPPAARIPAQELLDLVHREEGASVVSHPFRASAPSLRDKIFKLKGFDALEVLNGNSSQIENQRASEAALRLKLPGTGGSDSHSKGMVGRYATEFEEPISNEAELVAALKAGRYKPKDLTGRQN
jgi:predicted metal-dependent phosphoesterase TrpH